MRMVIIIGRVVGADRLVCRGALHGMARTHWSRTKRVRVCRRHQVVGWTRLFKFGLGNVGLRRSRASFDWEPYSEGERTTDIVCSQQRILHDFTRGRPDVFLEQAASLTSAGSKETWSTGRRATRSERGGIPVLCHHGRSTSKRVIVRLVFEKMSRRPFFSPLFFQKSLANLTRSSEIE